MRMLTVRQPWAWLLAAGWKDVENRSWSTKYRGPVAIHAGLSLDHQYRDVYPAGATPPPPLPALETGQIIAVAELVDVVTDSTSKWAQADCFHWILADPRPITPIHYVGALGLIWLPDEIDQRITSELALGAGQS
jgi:hypothetical protein